MKKVQVFLMMAVCAFALTVNVGGIETDVALTTEYAWDACFGGVSKVDLDIT